MTGRMIHGVTLYDRAKAFRGFTLFAPRMSHDVWIIDMEGRIVHRWHTDGFLSHAQLLPSGNLLCGVRILDEKPVPLLPSQIDVIYELDWDNRVVWQYGGAALHHDWCRLRNGNTLVSKYVRLPSDIEARVKGGIPASEWIKDEAAKGGLGYEDIQVGEKVMWGDCYQEITPEGKVVWEWKDYEHLDPDEDIIEPRASRKSWTMTNSLFELPDENILVSWLYLDTVAIINKSTGKIAWRY